MSKGEAGSLLFTDLSMSSGLGYSLRADNKASASSGLDPNGLEWYPAARTVTAPVRSGRAFGARSGVVAGAAQNLYGSFRERESKIRDSSAQPILHKVGPVHMRLIISNGGDR